jgi:hypothetical protein
MFAVIVDKQVVFTGDYDECDERAFLAATNPIHEDILVVRIEVIDHFTGGEVE